LLQTRGKPEATEARHARGFRLVIMRPGSGAGGGQPSSNSMMGPGDYSS